MAGANPSLSHLFAALDPVSLILSHFPTQQQKPNLFQLKTECFFAMERGPRYDAYAMLRESRLRSRAHCYSQQQKPTTKTPVTNKGCSVLAQSVPDFSAAVRKENRKPPMKESPPVKGSKGPRLSGIIGAKTVNSGEKKSLRKSYATMEEMKGGGKTVLGYKKY